MDIGIPLMVVGGLVVVLAWLRVRRAIKAL